MKEQFVWSDAWILLAVIYSGDCKGHSADRPAITKAADFINHAIATDEEINGALIRLRCAGFVEEDNGEFMASASTLEAYARATTPRRNVHQELEDMKRLLGVSIS